MPKILAMQTNFTSGELSPRLYAHVDVNKYKNGLKTATNVIIQPHGPCIRRNGSKYINEVKTSSKETRLIRFQFNQANAYVLELGDQYLRFYKNGAVLGAPYEVATPWLEAELFEVTYVQFGNTMYFAHFNHAPRKLVRTSDTTWTLSTIAFYPPATSEEGYQPNTTITPAATSGTSVNFTAGASTFLQGDVGRQIHNLSGTGKASITSITSTTVAVCDIVENFPNTSAISSGNWKLDLSPIAKLHTDATAAGVTANINSMYIDSARGPFKTITAVTQANPGIITCASHGFSSGDAVEIRDIVGMTFLNNKIWTAYLTTFSITNGTFASDLSSWTDASTGSGTSVWNSGSMRLGGGAAGVGKRYQAVTVTGNTLADLIFTTANSSITYAIGTTAGGNEIASAVVSPGSHTIQFQSGTTSPIYISFSNPNNDVADVDTVSISTLNYFAIKDSSSVTVNTSSFTPYSSGGTVRKVFTDVAQDTFRSADIGKFIVINGGIAEITAVTDAQHIKAEIQKSMSSASDTSIWSMEQDAWSSSNGYPRTISLYQNRLWFGSTDQDQQSVWGSETGIFDSIGIGSNDSDAIQLDLSTAEINEIQWMYGLRSELVLGTSGAEITINSGTNVGALTPSNLVQEIRSYNGSNIQSPIAIGNELVYIQRSGRKILSFRYSYEVDSYISDDLTFLAEHLAVDGDGIKELSFAQDPDRLIYAVCNDGAMLVGTYFREQQVIAWTKFTTDGYYESVQTISTGATDEVWVVVKRTINGGTKRYVERFDSGNGEDNIDGYSDCYLTYSVPKTITGITKANPAVVTSTSHGFSNGDDIKIIDVVGMTEVNGKSYLVANKTANTFELTDLSGTNINSTSYTTYSSGGEAHALINTVSGLSHLEAKEVQVKADGAAHANKTVSAGAITLDKASYEVTVGLPYTSIIATLNKEFNVGFGTEQGQEQRHVRPVIRVYKSILPTLNGEFLPARAPTDKMDSKLGLYSGDILYGSLTWDVTGILTLTTDKPLPFRLLGIFGSIEGGMQ